MVFNISAQNRDDHAKNFAFVMDPLGEWTLSPAYDMTHSTGPGGEHMMTVAGEGRALRREHVMKLAAQFAIGAKEVALIFDNVKTALAGWKRFTDEAGCTKRRSRAIASSFLPL